MLRTGEESMRLRTIGEMGIESRPHARGSERMFFFFLPIFIISVFRKFGRVAQHRSHFGFSHSRSVRRCPRFPMTREGPDAANRRYAISSAASVIREEMLDEADEERRNGRKRKERERRAPLLRRLRDVSEIATFCGTILSWRIVARCPYDTMTDVPLRHG